MNYSLEESIDAAFAQFWLDWDSASPHAFKDFLVSLCCGYEARSPDARAMIARAIAALMFVPDVDADPLREEITMVAGELEKGEDLSRETTWMTLVSLIDQLP